MSDQTTDPRVRYAEIAAARDLVVAAAVTWWGEQIATQDMPEGSEQALAVSVDAYMDSLQIQYDRAGLSATPAGQLLEQLADRRAHPLTLVRDRDDCGGA